MKVVEKNGLKIAVPDNGKVRIVDDLKALKLFAMDEQNECQGFYAEGYSGKVYDYDFENCIAVPVGLKGTLEYIKCKPLHKSVIKQDNIVNETATQTEIKTEQLNNNLMMEISKLRKERATYIQKEKENEAIIMSLKNQTTQMQKEIEELKQSSL